MDSFFLDRGTAYMGIDELQIRETGSDFLFSKMSLEAYILWLLTTNYQAAQFLFYYLQNKRIGRTCNAPPEYKDRFPYSFRNE